MRQLNKKHARTATLVLGVVLGIAFALPKNVGWKLLVNGGTSAVPIHVIKNMYFVSLSDLAKLPGWNVTVDLGARRISLRTPNASGEASAQDASETAKESSISGTVTTGSPAAKPPADSQVEAAGEHGGPPNNVRMMVKAALSSLDELRSAISDGLKGDALKARRDATAGIVQQAENLLWSLPRTRTLQADLQVALEDLQSQVNLMLALDQAKDGLLPWTHPTAQNLLMKYPDLHPCRMTKNGVDGLDVNCFRKMMNDVTNEDFNDVERDLDQYR